MKNTEQSYGAKLRKAQDGLQAIQQFQNFAPPRSQENFDEMNAFILQLVQQNDNIAIRQENYRIAVNVRQIRFSTDPFSLKKAVTLIRANVNALYGSTSFEAKQVAAIIRKIRGVRLQKAPFTVDSEEQVKKASTSQSSFGALTQVFKDLVNTLAQFQGYSSNKPELTLEGLNEQYVLLDQSNNDVASLLQTLSATRAQRLQQFDQLADSMLRIKNYSKAQYGVNSQEFNSLKQSGW